MRGVGGKEDLWRLRAVPSSKTPGLSDLGRTAEADETVFVHVVPRRRVHLEAYTTCFVFLGKRIPPTDPATCAPHCCNS